MHFCILVSLSSSVTGIVHERDDRSQPRAVVIAGPTSDLKSCCTLVGHWQLISLFSDYVLKQVDQYGKVILDYGHVRAEPEGE